MSSEEFKFAIVMAIYNTEDYLEEAIDSVIKQTIGFKDNIQLILVNDGSTDKSEEICLKYKEKYPENIVYLYQENQGQATARNNGLNYVKATYVNFLDSDDKLSLNALEEVAKFFDEHSNEVDLVSIPYKLFEAQEGEHVLNYKFYETRVIDIFKEYDCIQLSSSTCFIKNSVLEENPFPELTTSEDSVLVNKIILNKCKYGVVNNTSYNYRKRITKDSTLNTCHLNKIYFLERSDKYFMELINYSIDKINKVPKYIQFVIMYDLQWVFKIPGINNILSEQEINELNLSLINVLNYIDDDIIFSQNHINLKLKKYILYLKHQDKEDNLKEIHYQTNNIFLIHDNKHIIDSLKNHEIVLDTIDIDRSNLEITGFLSSFFDNDEIKIEAVRLNEVFRSKRVYYPQRNSLSLNKPFEDLYQFSIRIPIIKNRNNNIKFRIKYKSATSNLKINLNDKSKLSKIDSYSKLDDFLLIFRKNRIIVKPYSFKDLLKLEMIVIKNILKSREKRFLKILFIRVLYLLFYPYYNKKRIWLFIDRIDNADDNAEHLFKYSLKRKDNIKKYFIIKKESLDYKKMKKIGNVIPYNSFKHYILLFFAEKFISSHADEPILTPFKQKKKFFAGKKNYKYVFLQHGVTKDDLSDWLNKYYKNIKLFITSSKLEYDSIISGFYGYGEDVVKLTGMPRYDMLTNDSKNKIYIMPTWRKEIFKSENLKETLFCSNYYKAINDLINDIKLIKYCKENNYKLLFKPHPEVIPFIDLFEKNDYVKFIDFDKKYQDIYSDASLIITDYSSAVFDFAYLKKPIIYYQFNDHYHFEKGYFNYETMGFGEVINNHDEVVDKIIEYIDNDCEMSDKYKERVDEFFEFNDRNNCKRVYDEIMKL